MGEVAVGTAVAAGGVLGEGECVDYSGGGQMRRKLRWMVDWIEIVNDELRSLPFTEL